MSDLKISYDDNELDIMDGVNAALKKIGYRFEDDGQEHDGWIEYNLVKIGEKSDEGGAVVR